MVIKGKELHKGIGLYINIFRIRLYKRSEILKNVSILPRKWEI
jgi:hypothetical protein